MGSDRKGKRKVSPTSGGSGNDQKQKQPASKKSTSGKAPLVDEDERHSSASDSNERQAILDASAQTDEGEIATTSRLENTSKKQRTKESPNDDEDDDGDDDDELLAAAAAWADKQEDDVKTPSRKASASRSSPFTDPKDPKDLSLHITQLPYDTNELDLRRLFAENGCAVSSIRLVFDRDEKGRKTVFRGVAFVDVIDTSSYDKALLLNRKSSIRGRKLNIRPVRSKKELADIVTRTRELVQDKIKQQREGGVNKSEQEQAASLKAKKKEKKRAKKDTAKAAKSKSKGTAKHAKPSPAAGKEDTTKKGEKGAPERKLTKKERNRRAAILLSLKKRKG